MFSLATGRAVGALIAIIVMMVQPWDLGAAEIVPMAINEPPRLATKPIVVFDPAPNINKSLASLILSEVGRGKRSRSPFCLSLRQQGDGPRIEAFDFLEVLFVSVAGPVDLDCITDISSGQIPAFYERDVSDKLSHRSLDEARGVLSPRRRVARFGFRSFVFECRSSETMPNPIVARAREREHATGSVVVLSQSVLHCSVFWPVLRRPITISPFPVRRR